MQEETKCNRSERGNILIVVIVILFFLSAIWMVGLSRTTSEFEQVGNKKSSIVRLYQVEQALVTSYETPSTWLTDTFLQDANANLATASTTVSVSDPVSGKQLAQLTVRPIQNVDSVAAQNNRLPVQAHESAPPAGSGYGLNKFVVRRFGISAVSPDSKTATQSGVWVVLNK